MRIILNIGLNVSPALAPGHVEGYQLLPDLVVVAARNELPAAVVVKAEQHDSDSEPTMVVELDVLKMQTTGRYAVDVFQLAELLQQDAIAAYVPGLDSGFLAGPRAAEWGEFDRKRFIMPGGRRLA